jgi:hypothetical protein
LGYEFAEFAEKAQKVMSGESWVIVHLSLVGTSGGAYSGGRARTNDRFKKKNQADFCRFPALCRVGGVYSNPVGRCALRAVLACLLTFGRAVANEVIAGDISEREFCELISSQERT